MKKLKIFATFLFTTFVTNCFSQNDLGKSFEQISKNKYVTKIDTNSVTKYVVQEFPNKTVINFFDKNFVSNVASVTYFKEDDIVETICNLNGSFDKNAPNSWKITTNIDVIFDENVFYFFLKQY